MARITIQQTIQKFAYEIAKTYPAAELAQWGAAAMTLRQPYWGWDAEATYTLPNVITRDKHVTIIRSDGTTVNDFDNPFLYFTFPEKIPVDNPALRRFADLPRTARYADRNGNSQPDVLVK